jgi:hypothetical protein
MITTLKISAKMVTMGHTCSKSRCGAQLSATPAQRAGVALNSAPHLLKEQVWPRVNILALIFKVMIMHVNVALHVLFGHVFSGTVDLMFIFFHRLAAHRAASLQHKLCAVSP